MGDGHLPHLLEGQRDRRQGRMDLVGDELLVVNPDDGHVLTHPQPLFTDRGIGAHRHAVVAAHQPGQPGMVRQETGGGRIPVSGGTVADSHVHGAPGDAGLLQVGPAADAPPRSGLTVVGVELDDTDIAVMALQERLRSQAPHLLLVRAHAGKTGDRVDAVDQDSGDLAGLRRHANPAVPPGGVDDPLDPGLQQRLEGLGLHGGLRRGRHDEQRVAGGPDSVLDPADRGGGKGTGDDLGDQADERGSARGQGPCPTVRAVAELGSHLLDALTGLRWDPSAVAVVEHEGHRGARDAGRLGHVRHRGPVGVAHPLSFRPLRLHRHLHTPLGSGTCTTWRPNGSLPGRRRSA